MSENPRVLSTSERMTALGLPTWYAQTFGALVATVFALIALGGSVRVMNAGLACPDWPLCFGDVIPDYHPQVYFEFIHRALAGVVGIVVLGLQVLLFRSKAPRHLKWLGAASLALLTVQIVFGGLTVLWQLHSKVVAGHLALGTAFFSLLLWMYLSLKGEKYDKTKPWVKRWAIFSGLAVFGQIILGGLVASHFASLACTDFPKCQGEWFPTFQGIIGLHVIHRLGAYTLFAILLMNLWLMRSQSGSSRLKSLSAGAFAMVLVQIGIGIANVLLFTPPLIAVLHLAVATAILSIMVRQVHAATVAA